MLYIKPDSAASLTDRQSVVLYTIGLGNVALWAGQVNLALFLASRQNPELQELFKFKPSANGAISNAVKTSLHSLRVSEFIQRPENEGDRRIRYYWLTENGFTSYKRTDVDSRLRQTLIAAKKTVYDLNSKEQALYMYARYPSFVKAGTYEFKSKAGDRDIVAVSLYRRGKITFDEAAELSGLGPENFQYANETLVIPEDGMHRELEIIEA